MTITETSAVQRKIFSVSELNQEIKLILEKKYAFIWISGEISNFSQAASGHIYLTLKDRNSQIGAVIFRPQARRLNQQLKDGMQVTGFGRISVYEPRGAYQIILEYLEESGIGAILAEQEALKDRLRAEGLFEAGHKKKLPFLPEKIAVITSPTGAVIEDILNIADRRFDSIPIVVAPVTVQGEHAADEIVAALALVNERCSADVIILARGGGSVEDLRPFNSEQVARAIFASAIPVVSAVGHETDYTIADFVADLRAPTPSAAAELVLPSKKDLAQILEETLQRIIIRLQTLLNIAGLRLEQLSQRAAQPLKKLDDLSLRTDDLQERLIRAMRLTLRRQEAQVNWWAERMMAYRPDHHLKKLNETLEALKADLVRIGNALIVRQRHQFESAHFALNALNPNAILQRGYSITRILPEKQVVRDARQVTQDVDLEIILAHGVLRVKNMP